MRNNKLPVHGEGKSEGKGGRRRTKLREMGEEGASLRERNGWK